MLKLKKITIENFLGSGKDLTVGLSCYTNYLAYEDHYHNESKVVADDLLTALTTESNKDLPKLNCGSAMMIDFSIEGSWILWKDGQNKRAGYEADILRKSIVYWNTEELLQFSTIPDLRDNLKSIIKNKYIPNNNAAIKEEIIEAVNYFLGYKEEEVLLILENGLRLRGGKLVGIDALSTEVVIGLSIILTVPAYGESIVIIWNPSFGITDNGLRSRIVTCLERLNYGNQNIVFTNDRKLYKHWDAITEKIKIEDL